jgi:branched-chain amino acid transport system substrate-binding protein
VTEGFYSMTPVLFVAASDTRPEVTAFAERYKKEFGKEPNFAAQLGYTAAQLVVLALKNAGKDLNTDTFVAGMESIKDWHDIFGSPPMSFSPTKHQGSNESFMCVVKNGHWVPVSATPVGY